MFRSVPAATTVAAAIGILASSATMDQVSAVQLVADHKAAHKLVEDDDQDVQEDNTLLETRKQLDMVEEQLNQMKSETEANLEIAEEETQKHKTKSGKKHHKKSKHIKNKKVKAHKKHGKKEGLPDDLDDDTIPVKNTKKSKKVVADDDIEVPSSADMSETAESGSYSGVTADDEAFQSYQKKHGGHHKKAHKTHKSARSHSGHKKSGHAPHSAHIVNHEDDPFNTFEESLTTRKHHAAHRRVSHAQKKKVHKHHSHAQSVPACTSLGCNKDSIAKPAADAWPKDYPVANWGADHDMDATAKHTASAEAKLGAWNPTQDEDGNWVVPKVDAEFKLNARGQKFIPDLSQEKEELAGVKADVRLGSKSDPICSSAGCTQYEHPKKDLGYKQDYFVPHFGADHDIVTNNQNVAQAEAVLKHTFTPTQDEDGEWEVPTETAEFKLAGVKADVHLGKKKSKKQATKVKSKEDPAPAEDPKTEEEKAAAEGDENAAAKVEAKKEEKAKAEKAAAKKKKEEGDPSTEEGQQKIEEAKKAKEDDEKKQQIIEEKNHQEEEKEKKEKEENKNIDSCSRRKNGGKSKLLSDEEYKKCHSLCQQQSLVQCKKGEDEDTCQKRMKSGKSKLISDEEWTNCHSTCQKQSLVQNKEDPAPADAAPEKKEDPAKADAAPAEGEKKTEAPAEEGEKKSGDSAAKKEDENDPAVIKQKKAERDQAVKEADVMEKSKEEDPCTARLSGGKSSIVSDQEWAKCHRNAQVKSKHHDKNKNQKPEQKKAEKSEEKSVKEKSKLQTTSDLRSDPPFNSDDGYETRYMNPSDPKKIIEYPQGLAYDSDVIDTQAHMKASESAQGHKFDPVPFLAVQQKYDSDETQDAAQSAPEATDATLTQQQSSQKTAVKTQQKAKTEAKATAQTKAEKMTSFVAMRKKMMSNWGTK